MLKTIFSLERLEISFVNTKLSKTTCERIIQANQIDFYSIKVHKIQKKNVLIEIVITHHFSDLSFDINNNIC